jgi:hypothetical protein
VTTHNAIHYGVSQIQAIAKAMGLGDEEGVTRLGETLTPTVNLWEYPARPDWAFLFGEKLCGIFRTEGATAGEFSAVALLNPTNSGYLGILDKASFDQSGTNLAQLQYASEAQVATLGTSAKGNVLDRRWASTVSFFSVLSGSDASSGIGSSLEQRRSPGNATIDFNCLPLVLPPGFAAVVVLILVNTGLTVNFVWRERKLLPGELRAP